MKDTQQVNERITDRVQNLENERHRKFIMAILEHERDNLALEQPHYTDAYRSAAFEYAAGLDEGGEDE